MPHGAAGTPVAFKNGFVAPGRTTMHLAHGAPRLVKGLAERVGSAEEAARKWAQALGVEAAIAEGPASVGAPPRPLPSIEESVSMMLRLDSPFTTPWMPDSPYFAPKPAPQELHSVVTACPLFAALPLKVTDSLFAKVGLWGSQATGALVYARGQEAQEMYFVCAGEVQLSAGAGAPVEKVCKGGFFGEAGMLYGGCRSSGAVVAGLGACRLAVLRRADLEEVALLHGLGGLFQERGQALGSVRAWFAARPPLFALCAGEPGFLARVAGALQVRAAAAGETLAAEGEEGREMFFLCRGTVNVSPDLRDSPPVQLAAPATLGQVGLLPAEERWTETVRCATACSLYVLRAEDLGCVLQDFPRAAEKICGGEGELPIGRTPSLQSTASDDEFLALPDRALWESRTPSP